MPRGENLSAVATAKTRAKGGYARAAKLQAERRCAEALAEERLLSSLERALDRLEELLTSEDEQVALRAVGQVFDRVLGRPSQRHEHAGAVAIELQYAAARAKLNRLIESRARAIANGN
jgi:hypothetical protein